tara:strand:+ start:913 stop:1071 length:159 start_codon:yes stop_codon:yes gene_type:complete
MHVLVEVTESEIKEMDMVEEYQVLNFVESVLSNSLTITYSNVEVTVDVVVNK